MTTHRMIRVTVLAASVSLGFFVRAQDSNRTATEPLRGMNSRRNTAADLLSAQILSQGDSDGDGRLTEGEFTRLGDRWFDLLDSSQLSILSLQQFLEIEKLLPSPRSRAPHPGRPSPYLGFFVSLDTNKDSSITKSEFNGTFHRWFREWDAKSSGHLDAAALLAGLKSALPRTNMGAGAQRTSHERLPGLPEPPPSPVLPPRDSAKKIQLAAGFHVELAATEPLIEDPVSLSFDADGRLYVLEMRNFMLDIDRSGEREPIGRISLLVDSDQDGRFDSSTVFVDRLVMPRAVSAVKGGVLYVSDYQLYFARDTDGDGVANETELLDADYGGGNVEHAPNGLMPAMDNWIYNARSRYRYRWFRNTLVKQSTEHRGQWGITQDNYGRLFYNVNNSQLLGDYTPPNYMSRNQHYPTSAGLNLFVATDQRVFTRRMNTAVNRGYLPDVLDEQGKLYVFASSCGPVIYRGDNFPADFVGNAFVCDSAANLVKRNIVSDSNFTLTSRFAYDDSEFLASTDERFRPVNLFNGPDGTLWLVDMYRGINQYGVFMTDYLRRETLERSLDKGIHLGRIYRIVSDAKAPSKFAQLSAMSSVELVQQLSHSNGWVRDTAQRLLVERGDRSAVPHLLHLIKDGPDSLGRIHGLWTLEGLFVTLPSGLGSPDGTSSDTEAVRLVEVDVDIPLATGDLAEEVLDVCVDAMADQDSQVQSAAIRVAEALVRDRPEDQMLLQQELMALIAEPSPEVRFQAALTAGSLPKPAAFPLMIEIASEHPDELLVREAIVSGLHRWELPFLKALVADARWNEPRPGNASLIRALAVAITRQAHPINVDELLHLAAMQSSRNVWQSRSLLDGVTSKIARRGPQPIRLRREPGGMEALLSSNHVDIRERAKSVKERLAWPGHQFDLFENRPRGRSLTPQEQQFVSEGKVVFKKVCAGCHGLDGQGIRPLAAPLVDSDWVLGSKDRLVRVLLHGLTGAVTVDGVTYEPPIVLPEMPAVGTLEDAKIAAVLSYIRREWGHQAEPVTVDHVTQIRQETSGRLVPWTEKELSALGFDSAESD